MALYRALRRMTGVAQRGELTTLGHLNEEQIAKLIRVGAVAPISAPPLSELPGWASRAGKLAKIDILDVEQLAEADLKVIGKALRVKEETAARYQAEVKQYLVIPEPEEGED